MEVRRFTLPYMPGPKDNVPFPPSQPSITVHAQKENQRPVGFAPWPEQKTPAKRTPRTIKT